MIDVIDILFWKKGAQNKAISYVKIILNFLYNRNSTDESK